MIGIAFQYSIKVLYKKSSNQFFVIQLKAETITQAGQVPGSAVQGFRGGPIDPLLHLKPFYLFIELNPPCVSLRPARPGDQGQRRIG